MAKNWTEEDEQFIRDNFLRMTYTALAEHFGVSAKAMESKIRRMGLKKQEMLQEAGTEGAGPGSPGGGTATEVQEPPPPAPLGSLQPRRRAEAPRQTPEQRQAWLAAARAAAEEEKTRRELGRRQRGMAQALKRLESGIRKLFQGDHRAAAGEFEEILEHAPPDTALIHRARQYLDACRRRLEARETRLRSADDYYVHGVMLLNAGDPAGALEALEKALARAPGDDRILYCQAAAYARKGEAEAALDALRRAVAANDANRIYAKNDPDFVPLRVHQEFQRLVAGDAAEGQG